MAKAKRKRIKPNQPVDERREWANAYRKVWNMIHSGKVEMATCQECGHESVRFIMASKNFKKLNLRFFCQEHYEFAIGKGVRIKS